MHPLHWVEAEEEATALFGDSDGAPTISKDAAMSLNFKEKIYALTQKIPRGRVSTYGDLAAFAGAPRAAREVGWAMHSVPPDSGVPWWRVINSKGEISARSHEDQHMREEQAKLLRDEKIEVSQTFTLDLSKYRWRPRASTITAAIASSKEDPE